MPTLPPAAAARRRPRCSRFLRSLVLQVLRSQHQVGTKSIAPRVSRHQPVGGGQGRGRPRLLRSPQLRLAPSCNGPPRSPLPQVSWLGAWAILLGCRDYSCREHLLQDLPCLRPSEDQMLKVAALWAKVAAAAEVRAWRGC